MEMKAKIVLQGADYAEKPLGKMKSAQAVRAFSGTDWDGLCREARSLKAAGRDYCPPSFYVDYTNISGQRLSLHLYCEDASPSSFSCLETEKMDEDLLRYARRPPAPEKRTRGLDAGGAAAAIEEFYRTLPDKGLRIAHYGSVTYATTCRDFRNSIRVMLTVVSLCSLVVAGIGLRVMMQFPTLRPQWAEDLLAAQPWIEGLYRSVVDFLS